MIKVRIGRLQIPPDKRDDDEVETENWRNTVSAYYVSRPGHIDSRGLVSTECVIYYVRARRMDKRFLLEEKHKTGDAYSVFGISAKEKAADAKILRKAREIAKVTLETLTPQVEENFSDERSVYYGVEKT